MSARGDSCRAAVRNIGKNFVSAISMPLLTAGGSSSTEGCEGRRGARLVGTGDWPRSRVLTGLPKLGGRSR